MSKSDATFQPMNRLILSIFLIVSCCAVSLAGAPEVRFASGNSALNLPFKIFNNHIYLQVRVNDAKPLWFLLDTGSGNFINLRHARTLGLKLNPGGQTTGIGEGSADFFFTENVSYTLPGVTIAHEKFAVLSLENAEGCLTKINVDLQGKITWRAQAAQGDEAQPMDGIWVMSFLDSLWSRLIMPRDQSIYTIRRVIITRVRASGFRLK